MSHSPQSLKDIAKPITDGFYNSLINKDLKKNITYSVEQKTAIYNSLYKVVYEYVDNYFQKNTITTNDDLKKQLKIVVKNLTNILVNKVSKLNISPDNCAICCGGTCCNGSQAACFCC